MKLSAVALFVLVGIFSSTPKSETIFDMDNVKVDYFCRNITKVLGTENTLVLLDEVRDCNRVLTEALEHQEEELHITMDNL